jgi:broad specificity phosphatase PhoE
MKLFLVRHGETAWTAVQRYQGLTDIPLNRRGREQAKAVARALKKERPARLYVSALKRAKETAELIGRRLGLKPVIEPRLNEIDFGKWEGAYYRRLPRLAGKQFDLWEKGALKKPPGGESIVSLNKRVGRFLNDIIKRHSKETIIVVSHGGPIKMLLFRLLNSRCSIWSLRVDPASISLVEGNPRLFQIVCINRTDHL